MKLFVASLMFAALAANAQSQDRVPVSKAEMEGLIAGKKWNLVRKADGNKVTWDLRAGGRLYGHNNTNNGNDNGNWTLR